MKQRGGETRIIPNRREGRRMSDVSLVADVMSLERTLGLLRLMPYNHPDLKQARANWSAHLNEIRRRPDLKGSGLAVKVDALAAVFAEYGDAIDQQIQAHSEEDVA